MKINFFIVKCFGYKGIIAGGIEIDESTNIIFVNMHLPSGDGKVGERCKMWSKFLEKYQTSKIKHDYIFIFGDRN